MRLLVPLLLASGLVVCGCDLAHERGARSDAGPIPTDVGPLLIDECGYGSPPPSNLACTPFPGSHVCTGAPSCFEGHWFCPPGSQPTSDPCWCVGSPPPGQPFCDCSPSGWRCESEDAGPPPFTCPADTSVLVGAPCSIEGASCGTCISPCSGPCDQVTCVGGTWQGLDFGCADITFACGPSMQCQRWAEYCIHTLSDVSTIPDDYACVSRGSECSLGCGCFADITPGACVDDTDGGITVTRGGA